MRILRHGTQAICCTKISKSYAGRIVLSDVDLNAACGEIVCLRGVSGCGKTTLLNIIGLLDKPDSGTVSLFGKQAPAGGSSAAQRTIRQEINFLLQSFALVESATVEKNLLFSMKYLRIPRERKQQIAAESLGSVGLAGYMGKRVAELSGGEQQRVALARCLTKPGRIVLADEPTGSLDPKNRDMVMDILRKLANTGRAIVLATHDSEVVRHCDEVISL